VLRAAIASYGPLEEILTDNGPQRGLARTNSGLSEQQRSVTQYASCDAVADRASGQYLQTRLADGHRRANQSPPP
jgi:hypothetical protein